MNTFLRLLVLQGILFLVNCQDNNPEVDNPLLEDKIPTAQSSLLLGVDLSYVNEIETCSEGYYLNSNKTDVYKIFNQKGAHLVRVRLWHNPALMPPTFSPFSGLEDVEKTLLRAKTNGMEALLAIHYSDTWADPSKQWIPDAWKNISDIQILGDSLYRYTYSTLEKLGNKNLLPEMVQVGNEINSEILQPINTLKSKIDWLRNSFLLKKGIQAVRDYSSSTGKKIEIMLHIAQPENVEGFFDEAFSFGVTDFDWIGFSYYPKWSDVPLTQIGENIKKFISKYNKKVMIVETAYPYSLENFDEQSNLLFTDALEPGYPATPEGQKQFMIALTKEVMSAGGLGVLYWEPAWVANSCSTLFGTGSSWENATFFDARDRNEVLPVFDFFDLNNYIKP